jgi:GDPmannose 4,6-dehydratase
VKTDARCFRPAEVDLLMGNSQKARARLGWESRTGFNELIEEMVEADCQTVGFNLAAKGREKLAVAGAGNL